MKKVLLLMLALIVALAVLGGISLAIAEGPNEGDTPAPSSLNTYYFTIGDPGGGAQPPMMYTDSQIHTIPAGVLDICLQDVGVNPNPTPPSWADDIANVYVDGVLVGTYDSLNNPEPAPGPGPVQCFQTIVAAGTHTILAEAVYSWVAGSMFAKDIYISLIDVDVDIKPWSDPNSLNLKAKGVIPVAILGSPYFAVASIDVTTLQFACASPAHDLTDPMVYADHIQDVNMDGYDDLVAHYKTQDTCIENAWTEACTSGLTLAGIPFEGCDSINIVRER